MSLVIESGFWFIESGVSIQLNWLSASSQIGSILPDCFIRILVSSLLVVVHPVGSLQVLVCCRGIPSVRSPSLVDRCDRDSYHDSVSRILDGGFSRIISASRRI